MKLSTVFWLIVIGVVTTLIVQAINRRVLVPGGSGKSGGGATGSF